MGDLVVGEIDLFGQENALLVRGEGFLLAGGGGR